MHDSWEVPFQIYSIKYCNIKNFHTGKYAFNRGKTNLSLFSKTRALPTGHTTENTAELKPNQIFIALNKPLQSLLRIKKGW